MEQVLLQKNNYKEVFIELKNIIDARKVDLNHKHYVVVPDNFTLFTEKLLFLRGGALDAGVYSFNRLFLKMITSETYLPRHGAVMLIKKIISENAGKFRFYSLSASFGGFAEKIYDTIRMLANCMVSPDMLQTGSETDLKFNDIKLIYEKYLEVSKDKYVDAAGRLTLLEKAVLYTDLSNHTFYFAGFDGFTKQESAVIAAVSKKARKTVIISADEFSEGFGEVEFYEAIDLADQMKAAAKRMRAAAKEQGMRYSEMCMIAPPGIYMLAKRVMSEFNIPFYIDHKLNIGEQALSKYLKYLYRIYDKGENAQDMFALSKNYFAAVAKDDADIFENYCLKYCVDYNSFKKPFGYFSGVSQNGPHKIRQADLNKLINEEKIAEKVRKKLETVIGHFSSKVKKEMTAQDFNTLISDVLDYCGAEKKSGELSELSNLDVNSVPSKITACAELLGRIFPHGAINEQNLFEMFFEGLQATKVPQIPKLSDSLTIGDANLFRAGGYKYMFVIDFCDGSVPAYSKECALISDTDIDVLENAGVEIEPKVSKLNARNAADFFFAASLADKLFLAYSDSGEKRVSSSALNIRKNAKTVIENSFEAERDFLYNCDIAAPKDRDRIARHCSSRGNAAEMFLISKGELESGCPGLPFASEILNASNECDLKKYLRKNGNENEQVKSLFFTSGTTSVTVLQDYFLCPRFNFLKNGLSIKEREDGRMSPLDIGNFLHEAVENFVRNNRFEHPDREMKNILDTIVESNETYRLEANKALIERARAESVRLSFILADQIQSSAFVPFLLEGQFGYNEKDVLKPLALKLEDKEIVIKGKIDRADLYGSFIRIIDYKTGNAASTEFDFKKAYFGRQIQLLIYLLTAVKNGYKAGGLFYFPCSTSWNDDEWSHRLSGLCNNDPDVILAHDRNLKEPGYKSKIVNVKTKKNKKIEVLSEESFSGSFLYSDEQIENFCEYAYIIASLAAGEILGGNIDASPIENVCDFCSHKTACGILEKDVKRREYFSVKPSKILSLFNSSGDGGTDAIEEDKT